MVYNQKKKVIINNLNQIFWEKKYLYIILLHSKKIKLNVKYYEVFVLFIMNCFYEYYDFYIIILNCICIINDILIIRVYDKSKNKKTLIDF